MPNSIVTPVLDRLNAGLSLARQWVAQLQLDRYPALNRLLARLPKPRRPRPRTMRVGAAIAAGLAVVYTGIWFWEASVTRSQVKHFETAREAEGVHLSHHGLEIRGFPFSIEAQLHDVVVTGLPRLRATKIEMPMLTAHARPWQPNDWLFSAPDGVVAIVPDEGGGIKASAHELKGEVSGTSSRGWTADIRAGGLAAAALVAPVGDLEAASLRLHLSLPANPPDEHGSVTAEFSATLDRMALPQAIGPLKRVVDRIAFDGTVDGQIPALPLRAALAQWRDDGGTIELHHLTVNWQQLSVVGNGTVALDKDMQPLAAFSAALRGWPAMLDALVAQGEMGRADANFAKIGLALLARPGDDGQSELRTPITLQNGHLYLEKAKVAQVPKITWP